jgi:hypothetical protein
MGGVGGGGAPPPPPPPPPPPAPRIIEKILKLGHAPPVYQSGVEETPGKRGENVGRYGVPSDTA